MVEECYKAETGEPLNCLGSVQQFVQGVQDYTKMVFGTLRDYEEEDGYDDEDCY